MTFNCHIKFNVYHKQFFFNDGTQAPDLANYVFTTRAIKQIKIKRHRQKRNFKHEKEWNQQCCHLQSCQVVIRNERDILNVVTSKALEVASRPADRLGVWGPGVL